MIHNPALEAGQLQGIRNSIAKADAKLKEIQEKLLKRVSGEVKKGRRPTAESITKSVEAAFRQMKDTEHLSVRPIFHWTDEKINVHLFSCVLAYRLCCLAVKELADKGIGITINDLLGGMSEIRRVTTFFGDLGGTRPQQVRTFSRGNETAT